MATLFNTTVSTVAFDQRDGTTVVIPPKKSIELPDNTDFSAEMSRLIRIGKLVWRTQIVAPAPMLKASKDVYTPPKVEAPKAKVETKSVKSNPAPTPAPARVVATLAAPVETVSDAKTDSTVVKAPTQAVSVPDAK